MNRVLTLCIHLGEDLDGLGLGTDSLALIFVGVVELGCRRARLRDLVPALPLVHFDSDLQVLIIDVATCN